MYARFAKWRDDGTMEGIFHALSTDTDMENSSMDSTCVKVHENANSGEKTEDKAVGRTRGRLNTKLHTIVDGRPRESGGLSPFRRKWPRFLTYHPTAGTGQHQRQQCIGRPSLWICVYPSLYWGAWSQLCDPAQK